MRPSPSVLLAAVTALAAVGPACMEPLQNGGVTIIGDPSKRIGTLCRFRHGNDDTFCAADEAPVRPARVRRIASAQDGLTGPHASGRIGDYVLENDEIAVVIDQLGRGQGAAESGGNIVDAGGASQRVDALGQIFTSFGAGMRQPIYDAITTDTGADGSAWIEVKGRDAREPLLFVVTRYALSPGSRFLHVTTSLANAGDTAISGLDFGDTVLWGGAANGAGDRPLGTHGDATAPYLFGVGDGVAYALLTDGSPFSSKNEASWSSPVFARGVTIAPRAQVGYERMWMVTPRGDTAAIATELCFLGGGALGGVQVELAWNGKVFASPAENRVSLRRSTQDRGCPASPFPEPAALWLAPPASGPLATELAPGRYVAKLEGAGGTSEESAFEIKAGQLTKVQLAASPGGLLRARLLEVEPAALETARAEWAKTRERDVHAPGVLQGKPSPGKLQVLDAASGAAVVRARSVTGEHADVALPPGRYRVIASRGPEFSIDETVVEIAKGNETPLVLAVARVVDTRGYVGCDLHQHTSKSLDSPVTLEERLAASAAEGVECTVAAERNAVVDPQPIVDALGLGARLRAFPGNEIASDASREPFGHLAVFPLAPAVGDARGGAARVRDRSPREILDEMRASPGERVVVVSHPRDGSRGYFELLRFNPATGAGDAASYDGGFDGVEVWSGRRAEGRDRVLADFWALLRAAHPATPTASAYAHGRNGDEPGYPRTFVAVPDDDPAKLGAAELVAGLKKQRAVVLTNGPFVTMRAGDAREGGLASLGRKRRIDLTVRVERAPWVDATELTLFVGGVAATTVPLTAAKKTERGALLDELTFSIVLARSPVRPPSGPQGQPPSVGVAEDTFVVATVRGTKPLAPVLDGNPAETQPFAMTAPLWIDADGDGLSLGR